MARGELRIPNPDDEDRDAPEEQITKALAAVGLYAETPLQLEQEFALWPDCLEAFNLYCDLQTQWMVSPWGRRIGLNYAAVGATMAMRRIPPKRRSELLSELQTMEYAALKAVNQ